MRAKYGDDFYYITDELEVYSCIEESMDFENKMYEIGNYYLDYYAALKVANNIKNTLNNL